MATGKIKRGSDSAYTRLMRRRRAKALRTTTKICTVCGVKHPRPTCGGAAK